MDHESLTPRLSNQKRLPSIKMSTYLQAPAIRQTPKRVALPARNQIDIRRDGRASRMTGRTPGETTGQNVGCPDQSAGETSIEKSYRRMMSQSDVAPEPDFTTQSAIRNATTSERSPNARPDHFHGTHQCDDIADSGAPTIRQSTKTQGPEVTQPADS